MAIRSIYEILCYVIFSIDKWWYFCARLWCYSILDFCSTRLYQFSVWTLCLYEMSI